MRYIQKSREPRSLTQYRATVQAMPKPESERESDEQLTKRDRDLFDRANKQDLRDSLLKEQGYLCCYCLRRVTGTRNSRTGNLDTRIDHWAPLSIHNGRKGKPDLRFNYQNLLAACDGNENDKNSKNHHCDVRKGDREITINPTQRVCETQIYYSTTGDVCSRDSQIQKELGTIDDGGILNLNSQTFRDNRNSKLMTALEKLKQRQPTGTWSKASLQKAIRENSQPDSNGYYREYFPYIVFYLEKKLAQASP